MHAVCVVCVLLVFCEVSVLLVFYMFVFVFVLSLSLSLCACKRLYVFLRHVAMMEDRAEKYKFHFKRK